MAGCAKDAPAIAVEEATDQMRNLGSNPTKPADWNAEPGALWVCAIRSESSGVIHVGQTNNPLGRIQQHNDPDTNRSLYTKRVKGPWTLVHQESFTTRRAAMDRENFLKTGQGREWLQELLRGGASPPPAD